MGPTAGRAEGSGHRRHLRLQRRGPTRLRPAGHAHRFPWCRSSRPEHPQHRQIATAFQPLVDHPMRYLGGDGPDVAFVPAHGTTPWDAGDDQIDKVPRGGLATPGRRATHHQQPAPRTDRPPGRGWCREVLGQLGCGSGLYGHVLGFSDWERRAVVPRGTTRELFESLSWERLYVSCRGPAIGALQVCGDLEFIVKVGGPDLARRLEYLDPSDVRPVRFFIAALSKARIPAETIPSSNGLAQAIGIAGAGSDGAQFTSPPKRRDGYPDLHIYHGIHHGLPIRRRGRPRAGSESSAPAVQGKVSVCRASGLPGCVP